MSDSLYARIVQQLIGFDGVVQWFYLNEPLLDPDHIKRIAVLRAFVPRCTIHLTTNWDVMWGKPLVEQRKKIKALFDAGVNSLNLNDYDGKGYETINAPYIRVAHCWKRITGQVISYGPLPTRLHSWGKGKTLMRHCARPHRHIVVCWDGSVPICCAVNPLKSEKIGDANTQSLSEIWQSRRMWEYREQLQAAKRVWDCEGCDETMAFPHVVRKCKTS